ncbi:hypothetical protein [Arthrobacter sp. Cr_A7]|uniref:hypothetical protein n=1 Tax=Arthrobacter sp. Cr_A7 TaxID=3031017 RepID=UPI0023DBA55B|nr:hypothetical protein [Arthrobacter sp. Cr_A7]
MTMTSKGQYLQTTMNESDPAWNLNPAIVDANAVTVDPAVLLEGYRFILTFMAEEGIDSPLNGGGVTAAEWYAENEDQIREIYRGDVRKAVVEEEGRHFVLTESHWQGAEKYGGAYSYVYDPSRPRLLSRVIRPTNVWQVDSDALSVAVKADVSYEMVVLPKPGTTEELVQPTNGFMTYSAALEPDGKWRIEGYDHDIKTTEAW